MGFWDYVGRLTGGHYGSSNSQKGYKPSAGVKTHRYRSRSSSSSQSNKSNSFLSNYSPMDYLLSGGKPYVHEYEQYAMTHSVTPEQYFRNNPIGLMNYYASSKNGKATKGGSTTTRIIHTRSRYGGREKPKMKIKKIKNTQTILSTEAQNQNQQTFLNVMKQNKASVEDIRFAALNMLTPEQKKQLDRTAKFVKKQYGFNLDKGAMAEAIISGKATQANTGIFAAPESLLEMYEKKTGKKSFQDILKEPKQSKSEKVYALKANGGYSFPTIRENNASYPATTSPKPTPMFGLGLTEKVTKAYNKAVKKIPLVGKYFVAGAEGEKAVRGLYTQQKAPFNLNLHETTMTNFGNTTEAKIYHAKYGKSGRENVTQKLPFEETIMGAGTAVPYGAVAAIPMTIDLGVALGMGTAKVGSEIVTGQTAKASRDITNAAKLAAISGGEMLYTAAGLKGEYKAGRFAGTLIGGAVAFGATAKGAAALNRASGGVADYIGNYARGWRNTDTTKALTFNYETDSISNKAAKGLFYHRDYWVNAEQKFKGIAKRTITRVKNRFKYEGTVKVQGKTAPYPHRGGISQANAEVVNVYSYQEPETLTGKIWRVVRRKPRATKIHIETNRLKGQSVSRLLKNEKFLGNENSAIYSQKGKGVADFKSIFTKKHVRVSTKLFGEMKTTKNRAAGKYHFTSRSGSNKVSGELYSYSLSHRTNNLFGREEIPIGKGLKKINEYREKDFIGDIVRTGKKVGRKGKPRRITTTFKNIVGESKGNQKVATVQATKTAAKTDFVGGMATAKSAGLLVPKTIMRQAVKEKVGVMALPKLKTVRKPHTTTRPQYVSATHNLFAPTQKTPVATMSKISSVYKSSTSAKAPVETSNIVATKTITGSITTPTNELGSGGTTSGGSPTPTNTSISAPIPAPHGGVPDVPYLPLGKLMPGFGEYKGKSSLFSAPKISNKYSPDLISASFGITASKAPKRLTGLELRPVISKSKGGGKMRKRRTHHKGRKKRRRR